MSDNCKVVPLDFREIDEYEIELAYEVLAPGLAENNEPAKDVAYDKIPGELGPDTGL